MSTPLTINSVETLQEALPLIRASQEAYSNFTQEQVDAMIVIGGRNSSNTQKLFEICKNECKNTYYIQTSDEMDYTQIRSNNNVGITAGASTPNNIIEEVSKNVRNEL